ncbi:MAG TPA: hypothetical protein VMU51_23050 [Mycobacteriales bacterium]|nr:hypothetical protein [Mycobacteriales bacterium]
MGWRWFGADGLLALAGLAIAGVLGFVAVSAPGGFARLVALNLLCSLVIGASAGIVISIRAARAGAQRRRRGARLMLGQVATGTVLAAGLCVLGGLVAGLVAYPDGGIAGVVLLGGGLGVLGVLVVGLPVGLATGLVNGCRLISSRPR